MGRSKDRVAAIVMAAGQGKRLKSSLPKVLHLAAGRPLVGHVVSELHQIGSIDQIAIVVSANQDGFRTALGADAEKLTLAVQDPPNGTGDAARVGVDALESGASLVLVLPGDTPLLTAETLSGAIDAHNSAGAAATVLTARVPDATGYGRIVRDAAGDIARSVEGEFDRVVVTKTSSECVERLD